MPGAELSKGSWKGSWNCGESLKYNEVFTVTTESDWSLHHGTSAGAEIGLEDSKHRLHWGREDTPGALRTQRTPVSQSSLSPRLVHLDVEDCSEELLAPAV